MLESFFVYYFSFLYFLVASNMYIIFDRKKKKRKEKNPEMTFNSQQIVLYCLGLCTQNPGLILGTQLLELSPKRGSDQINMLKQGTKTKNKSYSAAWTHIWISALRVVDLESSVKRGTNKTEALNSLYWLSQNLHLKQIYKI